MAAVKPTTKQVAKHIRARTRTDGSKIVGDFNDETTPTGKEVEGIIDEVVEFLEGEAFPCDEKPKLEKQFTAVAALAAAMEVESSYWPDQVGTERSNYDQLKERYDERKKAYVEGVEEQCEGGDPTEGGQGARQKAMGGFPDASGIETEPF